MPKPTEAQLRGCMAQVIRQQQKSFQDITRPEVNQMLRRAGLDEIHGNEMADIREAINKGPYPTHGPDQVALYSFGYWFNYFYAELPAIQKSRFAVEVIDDDGSFRNADQVPAQALLENMLHLGFRRFWSHDHLTAEQVQARAIIDQDDMIRGLNVLFRGDGRRPQQIRQHGGTIAQSQLGPDFKATRNMTQPWHPFRGAGDLSVWLRNGRNQDNCLFSAVSVTPDFQIATKFPMLESVRGENPQAVGHAQVLVRPSLRVGAAGGGHVQQLSRQFDQERRTLLATKTNVYAVRTRGAYDTQHYQTQRFAEFASDQLAWADHLVWFSVIRIHYSQANANAGHLIVVNDFRWLQGEQFTSDVLLGADGMQRLKSFVDSVVQRCALHADGSGGMVYRPIIEDPFEILRVDSVFEH